jgi:hypothetical protein
MAVVKCPECGERVRYRPDEVKLRCSDCGTRFRAPDEDDDPEDERPRSRATRQPSNRYLRPAIIAGGLAALVVLAVVVVVLLRGRGDDDSVPWDSTKVTPENFGKVNSAMDRAEIEQILGGSRLSSAQDAVNEFRKADRSDTPEWMRVNPRLPGNAELEWRRWDGPDFKAWVAFMDTKQGQLSVYGVGFGPRFLGSFTNSGEGIAERLEAAYVPRKKTEELRKDPKWLRGAQARTALLGEWRKDTGDGWLFEAGGKLKPFWDYVIPPHETQPPTYRFLDDLQLEISHPPFGDMPTKFIYEYYVLKDELVLIDVTPVLYGRSTRNAQYFYRMPPTPGSLSHTKLIQPLVAELKNPAGKHHSGSLGLLMRFDNHALPLLRELVRTAPADKKSMFEGAILTVEAHLAREKERDKR